MRISCCAGKPLTTEWGKEKPKGESIFVGSLRHSFVIAWRNATDISKHTTQRFSVSANNLASHSGSLQGLNLAFC